MKIKTFDLVEVNDIRGRVMSGPSQCGMVNVSGLGKIGLSAVKLVESVSIPTFEVGDEVTVTQITIEEQLSYTYGWNHRMSKMMKLSALNGVTHTITNVQSSNEGNGFRYKLDGVFWFAPYHLRKVIDYDLI